MAIETECLSGPRTFPKTDWTLLGRRPSQPQTLEFVARGYWKPLYFNVRKRGFDVETSKDIVQEFLAVAFTSDAVSRANPALGKFRSFILGALSNFIKDRAKSASRLKRGGGAKRFSLDLAEGEAEYAAGLARDEGTPEAILNRAWARRLLEQSLRALTGSPSHLRALRLHLDGESYDSIVRKTGLTVPAAKVAVHRLRGRLRVILVDMIAGTVESDADLESEISEFIALLA